MMLFAFQSYLFGPISSVCIIVFFKYICLLDGMSFQTRCNFRIF